MKVVAFLVLAVSACGNDLPPLVLTTPHLRYHARSPDKVPPGASAWIEEFRTDLLTYFGVVDSQRDVVIDYYLFDDSGDLVSNTPCPVGCTTNDQPVAVYTTRPLDDYELVHGFLTPIGGVAPHMIAEGAARNVSCYPRESAPNLGVSSWQELVGQEDSNTQIAYGERVVHYLLDQYGPARLIKYYADAHFTKDPALFALDFERSFGVTFSSVWDAAFAVLESSVKPICPCTLEPLALNSTFSFDFPGHAFYRPLNVPAGRSLLVNLPPGSGPELQDCAQQSLRTSLATRGPPFNGTNLAVLNLSGENYLTFRGPSDQLTTAVGDWVTGYCTGASPITVSAQTIGLTIVGPDPAEGTPEYLTLSIEGSRQIALANIVDPSTSSGVQICQDCALTACAPLGGTSTPISGNAVLVIDSLAPGTPYRNLRITFE